MKTASGKVAGTVGEITNASYSQAFLGELLAISESAFYP